MEQVEITMLPFTDQLAQHFTDLNTAWLQKYFVVEAIDAAMLKDPESYFIDTGGHIYFAAVAGNIAGTFALLKTAEKGVYELSKMAVSDNYQGHKIGNKMMAFCIEKAAELGAGKIILYSNTILLPAIHLYKKYGFKEVPILHSDYKRSNIKMELEIL